MKLETSNNMPHISIKTNKYKVIVRRNYYGEILEEERIIEGETFERAKFLFNMESLLWSVARVCN